MTSEGTEETTATLYSGEALLDLFVERNPGEAQYVAAIRAAGRVDEQIADAIERGPVNHQPPFNQAEAEEILAWWVTPRTDAPVDGIHGPGCECGQLTPVEEREVEEILAFLAPALAEALGVGRTPAEKRTGVGDPEAAILDALGSIRSLVDAYGKAAGAIGAAAAHIPADPHRAASRIAEESAKLRKHYLAIRDVVALVSSLLPAVRGARAIDQGGLPVWFRAGTEGLNDWLTTAQAESPGEDWRAVYVR